jgi:hypothetical protein
MPSRQTDSESDSASIYFKTTPEVRRRVEVVVKRYDSTFSSVSRMAYILGLEALEKLTADPPWGVGIPRKD